MKKIFYLVFIIISFNKVNAQTDVKQDYVLPKAAQVDPVLEKQMIKACKDYWEDVYKINDGEVKKVYIMEKKWSIINNELSGAPLRKSIHAIVSTSINKECRLICVDFCCDHEGGGKYGPIYYFGACYEPGSDQTIPCK